MQNNESLSIIIPVKNEEENIVPLYDEICKVLKDINFEIIYIDDGSTDNSLEILQKIYLKDKRVKIVNFKTNYGKSASYTAGFDEASYDLIATMDGDFQDDPKDLLMLYQKINEQSADIIVGRKITGKSSFITFILSNIFNFFIRLVSGLKIHDLNCPMRIMRSEVAMKLNLYAGLFRYIPIIAKSKGFSVSEYPIGNRERLYGKSNYSGKKYFKSFFDFITIYFLTKYSERPLHVFGTLGMISFFIGFCFDFFLTIGFVFLDFSIKNNLGILLFGILLIILGVQLVSTGLLGEMINHDKIINSSNSRYIIKQLFIHTEKKKKI